MAKNTHLEHLEDDIFNQGYAGGQNAISFLEALRDMLTAGKGGSNTKVTVKWDGAPAIFCGRNPETGNFFVGTKSIFNKTDPKICFNDMLIDHHYPEGRLNGILKQCLKELQKLPIKGMLQGDLLYTETPPQTTMGGKRCYKFRPNTITYCVEKDTELGKKVGKSKMGIVFHTKYTGSKISDMSASFGVDVSSLQNVPGIAVFSAEFQNTNGIANLSSTEINAVNNSIRTAKRNLTASRRFLDEIGGTLKPMQPAALFKIFFNQKIREGKIPATPQQMLVEFKKFVESKYAEKEAGVKKIGRAHV